MRHRIGGFGQSFPCLISLALLSTLALSTAASDITLKDEDTGEVILLAKRRIHSVDSPWGVERLWLHGGGRGDGDGDALFDEEDAAYGQWVLETKRKQQRVLEEQKKDLSAKAEAKDVPKKASKPSVVTSFTSASLKARTSARRSRLKELMNSSSIELAWDVLHSASDHLRRLLSGDSLFAPDLVADGTPEERYIRLVTNAFSHTARNITTERRDEWVAGWISAVSYPILLDGEAVKYAGQELRNVMDDVKKLQLLQGSLNATDKKVEVEVGNTENSSLQTGENLRVAASIINASRNAHQMVITLAHPLISHVRNEIASQLREAEMRIMGNDESTVALRQELREWMKRKNSLKSAREKIAITERKLRGTHSAKMLLPKDNFVMCLALIARVRLGRSTGIDGLDMLPDAGLSTAITGALEKELKDYLCLPLGLGVVISAIISWLLLATRAFWVSQVRPLRMQQPAIAAPAENQKQRQRRTASLAILGLRLNLLVEAVVPFLIPLLVLHHTIKRKETSLYPILLFARPSQRLAVGIILFAFLIVSSLLSSCARTLYHFLMGGGAPYCRQQQEMKKKS